MKNKIISALLFVIGSLSSSAQTTVASSKILAQPIPDRTLMFSVTDPGVSKPITWGLDLAWLSEANFRRGLAFMGTNKVEVVRASFQPTLPLVNGDLQSAQVNDLNTRLNLIDLTDPKTKIILNCDHPSVDASYVGNAANWAQLIDATAKRVLARGHKLVSISPFNEPDFGWGQYSGQNGQQDFYNICGELRKNPLFDSVRLSGGNTLNCDQALNWYNYLKPRLDEGNTHQLAGSFDNYASFFQAVRANGDHATADEMHNVMDAMVGVEYGLQSGIWWGTAEYARGEFVRASDGQRLGYAEHRPNWTAASVYRNPDGKVQAFGGTSERQGVTTTYRFVSKDRDLFFDGNGPQREYTMILPGGTGYQNGQSNAERVVNISWGADIQPVINGKYALVNRNSGKVMAIPLGATTSGTYVRQLVYTGANYQQWNVTPVDPRIGGDFSYFTITAVHSSKAADILNSSLDDGGILQQYDDNKNATQQWYFEYAEDGWFYIRSRQSSKCLEVVKASTSAGAGIQQWTKTGTTNQQWRFIPVGAAVEFVAPGAPKDLTATPNAESIRLDWTANTENDVAGYSIFRSESAGGPYNTIARNITTNAYVDNTANSGTTYYYTVKAVDNSLNRSEYSTEVSAVASGNHDLVAQYQFEGNTQDTTINRNNASAYGTATFVQGKFGKSAISLNGSNAFVQLPTNIARQKEFTFSAWVYWKGGSGWQRIFDFGNSQTQYMFLTPNNGSGQLRFAIKNEGAEQQLNTTSISAGKWSHVAITLSPTAARIYLNGKQTAESAAISISPFDFKPILNYLGRSQFSDPLLNGYLDDVRVYNYALSASEIADVVAGLTDNTHEVKQNCELSFGPVPTNSVLHINYTSPNNSSSTLSILGLDGKQSLTKKLLNTTQTDLNVSNLPSGVYLLKLTNNQETVMKKFVVRH